MIHGDTLVASSCHCSTLATAWALVATYDSWFFQSRHQFLMCRASGMCPSAPLCVAPGCEVKWRMKYYFLNRFICLSIWIRFTVSHTCWIFLISLAPNSFHCHILVTVQLQYWASERCATRVRTLAALNGTSETGTPAPGSPQRLAQTSSSVERRPIVLGSAMWSCNSFRKVQ